MPDFDVIRSMLDIFLARACGPQPLGLFAAESFNTAVPSTTQERRCGLQIFFLKKGKLATISLGVLHEEESAGASPQRDISSALLSPAGSAVYVQGAPNSACV